MKFPNMFSPVQIGTVTVPNRFVVPPMGNDLANTGGSLSERSLSYYQARAKGGFGLITIESTVVYQEAKGGPRKPCLFSDDTVESFRRVHGKAYATTMCTGNLRSGTELLCAFFRTHEKNLLRDALRYGGILLTFAAGAGLGSVAALAWGAPAIWCSCVFLAAGFGLMFLSGAPGGENDDGKGV